MLNLDYNYPLYDKRTPDKPSHFRNILSVYIIAIPAYFKRLIQNRKKDKTEILEFIESLNFFCFWNDYDYGLLKQHYHAPAAFIKFGYFNASDYSKNEIPAREKLNVLINNSASVYGNCLTVLEKVFQIVKQDILNELIVPLSYGDQSVKGLVIAYGEKKFGKKFVPLLHFIEKKSYYKLIQKVRVAFFGARRQKAAGNIFFLLKLGVKVFLRKDNSMLKLLKEKGFIIFNFEADFNTVQDLKPLTPQEIKKNQDLYHFFFNNEIESEWMKKLLHS